MFYNIYGVKYYEQYLFDLTSVLLSPFFCSTHSFFILFLQTIVGLYFFAISRIPSVCYQILIDINNIFVYNSI